MWRMLAYLSNFIECFTENHSCYQNILAFSNWCQSGIFFLQNMAMFNIFWGNNCICNYSTLIRIAIDTSKISVSEYI